jgi:hypothetical protein
MRTTSMISRSRKIANRASRRREGKGIVVDESKEPAFTSTKNLRQSLPQTGLNRALPHRLAPEVVRRNSFLYRLTVRQKQYQGSVWGSEELRHHQTRMTTTLPGAIGQYGGGNFPLNFIQYCHGSTCPETLITFRSQTHPYSLVSKRWRRQSHQRYFSILRFSLEISSARPMVHKGSARHRRRMWTLLPVSPKSRAFRILCLLVQLCHRRSSPSCAGTTLSQHSADSVGTLNV